MHAIALVLVVIAALFALGMWAFCAFMRRTFPPEVTRETGAVIPLRGQFGERRERHSEAYRKAA